jgi:hypothetical protein
MGGYPRVVEFGIGEESKRGRMGDMGRHPDIIAY